MSSEFIKLRDCYDESHDNYEPHNDNGADGDNDD